MFISFASWLNKPDGESTPPFLGVVIRQVGKLFLSKATSSIPLGYNIPWMMSSSFTLVAAGWRVGVSGAYSSSSNGLDLFVAFMLSDVEESFPSMI